MNFEVDLNIEFMVVLEAETRDLRYRRREVLSLEEAR